MIEVSALTVRFGGVIPIDGMTVTFPGGTCGLIGPNGAGKTTFFNVLSGFVRPAAGSVRAFGEDILAMADYRRARWGLRRTFQTEQAVEDLSVFDNVLMVHENTSSNRSSRREEVAEALAFVGLDKVASQTVAVLGARERRLVEVARAVTGKPRVVLLDEPAAGLPDEETEHLGRDDLEHPREVRRARHPRRPRHEPRLGVLPDDRRARLRQADRFGTHGRGAARRARHACVPRNRGGALSAAGRDIGRTTPGGALGPARLAHGRA